jgi:hypothetical protein
MKQKIFAMLAAGALLLAACGKDNESVEQRTDGDTINLKFTLSGDWQQNTKDLTANGSSMTDVWVFDYVDNTLVQTVHQDDNTASDFGSPTLDLAFGTHTLYFVASRGLTPTVNTTDHNITWVKPSDTFHKALTLTVNSETGAQSVTLERMVAKLKMTINDAIATGTMQFLVTPAVWYYGMDYTSGDPVAQATNQAITVSVPSSYVGESGKFLSVFTFSSSAQWNTNVTLAASNGTSTISSVTINNVPFQRNHSTEYSGNLFTNGGTTSLTLNDTWGDPFTGTW